MPQRCHDWPVLKRTSQQKADVLVLVENTSCRASCAYLSGLSVFAVVRGRPCVVRESESERERESRGDVRTTRVPKASRSATHAILDVRGEEEEVEDNDDDVPPTTSVDE